MIVISPHIIWQCCRFRTFSPSRQLRRSWCIAKSIWKQEKQLVDELRSAQNKYFTKRAQNEAEEQAVMNSFQNTSPPPMSNGPTSGNYSYSMKKTHTFSTDKSPEPVITYPSGDSSFSTTTYRTESHSNKPPPPPGQQRITSDCRSKVGSEF
jgi:hypothetical protein